MTNVEREGEHPVFEGYRVIERIRSGPVTEVYRAELESLGRTVFIKTLGHGILPSSPFASALEREARLLAALDDPHVLRLFDFVSEPSSMWLVLEHVDGWTLRELLDRKERLRPASACAIALGVAEGLVHAHARGIVHRDLQPENVLVSREGLVKLSNFAAATDERLPTAPELLEGSAGFGTPAYMSPEQLFGEREDPRSDLFSLGIILYEMIAGRRPFDAPDDRAASHRIRHEAAEPLGRVVPEVGGGLDRIARRCLEKMPSDRFPTAAALQGALRAECAPDGEDPAGLIRAELVRLHFVAEKSERREAARAHHKHRPFTLGTAFVGYLVAFALVLVGGAVIRYGSAAARSDSAAGARLPLVPQRTGYLRVVADPWANVFVDGEPVDTTPFARSIPLSAGIHYVRLEHPKAPVERRTVRLSPSETVLLDVKMDVRRPRGVAPEASASAGGDTDPATP